jgi:hypothetical protein
MIRERPAADVSQALEIPPVTFLTGFEVIDINQSSGGRQDAHLDSCNLAAPSAK